MRHFVKKCDIEKNYFYDFIHIKLNRRIKQTNLRT